MSTTAPQLSGPGFVAMLLDVPFPISIPSAAYLVFDPVKGVAAIECQLTGRL